MGTTPYCGDGIAANPPWICDEIASSGTSLVITDRHRPDNLGRFRRRTVTDDLGAHRRWIRAGHSILTAMCDDQPNATPAARQSRVQQLGRDILDQQQLTVPVGAFDTRTT